MEGLAEMDVVRMVYTDQDAIKAMCAEMTLTELIKFSHNIAGCRKYAKTCGDMWMFDSAFDITYMEWLRRDENMSTGELLEWIESSYEELKDLEKEYS